MTLSSLGGLFAADTYRWQLSLIALAAIVALPLIATQLLTLIPAISQTRKLNRDVAAQRVTRDQYQPIQRRSMFWGIIVQLIMFGLVMPFVITSQAQPWWLIVTHVIAILMVYDFIYYLTHRFVFHDGGFGPGPLIWVLSVHHRQHNPCRMDSNYLHPLETAIGTGLYCGTIGGLGWLMGDFHVITLVITSIAFAEVNLHNHDRMEASHPPFRYLKYASDMHHVHHRKFNAGNFATITLFYDWLFGTYDTGNGWGKNRKDVAATKSAQQPFKPTGSVEA